VLTVTPSKQNRPIKKGGIIRLFLFSDKKRAKILKFIIPLLTVSAAKRGYNLSPHK
jgi:hypothetical protein